jgi:transposase
MIEKKVLKKIKKIDFEKIYKEEKDAKAKERYLAFVHLKDDKSVATVAKIIRRTRQTIYNWIERFTDGGLESLINDCPGRGRKPFLKEDDFEVVREEIEKLQDKGGHATANEIRDLLEEKFNVQYKMKSIYDVLERIDFSWISGRSKHPKSDPVAQEAFKKTSNPRLHGPCRKILI